MRLLWFVGLVLSLGTTVLHAEEDGDMIFNISELDKGQSVTLPRPATTLVPLDREVKFTSTDLPQNLIVSFPAGTPVGQTVEIQIFDSFSDQVKTLKLRAGSTALYSFKALSSIRLVPKMLGKKGSVSMAQLKIESNKPLAVGL